MITIRLKTPEEKRVEVNSVWDAMTIDYYNGLMQKLTTLINEEVYSNKINIDCKVMVDNSYRIPIENIRGTEFTLKKIEKQLTKIGYEVSLYYYSKTTFNKDGRYANISVQW